MGKAASWQQAQYPHVVSLMDWRKRQSRKSKTPSTHGINAEEVAFAFLLILVIHKLPVPKCQTLN